MNNQVILAIMFTGAAGFVLALVLLAAQWRYRAQSRRDFEGLQRSFALEQKLCADTFLDLKRHLAAREQLPRETPKPGALSRSTRAEALRLLRSGLSHETAASSLGIGKREMRLLERVAHTLCAR
jgi:hypothetical protein